jgi:hypothetical protein
MKPAGDDRQSRQTPEAIDGSATVKTSIGSECRRDEQFARDRVHKDLIGVVSLRIIDEADAINDLSRCSSS